nr:ATP-binding cassette domain-containing protein [uncultured Parasutterella sp.]
MINLDHVTYQYPFSSRFALEDISLNVSAGEVVLVTGVSGCGKSTLIRLINGLCPHYYGGSLKGRVKVCGRDNKAEKLSDISHRVGTLFQNPESQFFALGVEEEMAFMSECRGTDPNEIDRKIADAANRFGLNSVLKNTIHELSQGQKQKVGLASLMMEPLKVLILDEPTGNLDPESTEDLAREVQKLKEQGTAILVVDHRLYWLKDVADRVIVLEKGRIIREGTFNDLDPAFRSKVGLREISVTDCRDTLPVPMSASHPILSVRDLTFEYPGRAVMRHFNMELPKGICGVFGENGAGKTTLARLLTGLNKAKEGSFAIRGQKLDQKECLRHVAVVLQNADHQLYMRTVFEELQTSLEAAGCKGGSRAAEELLGLFDLQDLKDRHPHSLSGGQKQRLVIACAFAKNPDVIILDEPTSGLDGANLKRIASALKRLSDEGKAVLVITHDLELIQMVCQSAVILKKLPTTQNTIN